MIGSPGLACGCAAGDRIRVAADGQFDVMRRGGNLCLVVVPPIRADRDEIAALRSAFGRLGGLVDVPATGRFIVITIPVAAGFPPIEEAVGAWASIHNADWYFGNVYDDAGRPLNWWADQSAGGRRLRRLVYRPAIAAVSHVLGSPVKHVPGQHKDQVNAWSHMMLDETAPQDP